MTTATATAMTSTDRNDALHKLPNGNATVDTLSDLSSELNSREANQIGGHVESANEINNGKNGGDKAENGEEKGKRSLTSLSHRPSAPAHRRIMESPLSSDAIFKQSHAGLFNLCIVVLVAVNSRLIIENLMKYGLLIRTGFWFSSRSLRDWPLFMCCLSLPVLPVASFVVEKLAHKKSISEPVVVVLHIFITTLSVLYPVLVILRCDSAVLSGVTLMLFACIVWLKLVSYAHTNYDLRALSKAYAKEEALFGSKMYQSTEVSFKSLVYFMLAPTMCYQPSYPRTACIRKRWVARQLVKLIIFTGLMGFIIEQYINPIVKNSQHPLKGNLLTGLERVLKLSVPILYVWLCMFYCFFHLWLNILAELLRFGDREFYKDWWNAKSVEEYWRMWNMPVHKWMIRHVYFPSLRNGIPKMVAVVIAFFVSAIFHELCIAVPCHIFKFWAFIGIMFQVPLVIVTNFLQNKFQNSMVGNMIFWCSFCIFGQPMSVLLYYHDLMNRIVGSQ
ncbi:diacylglycerol O-acyltransferase 1-like [Impatiens glandulifera]|uniref:diacylglycerol O-acyltransferase 1-like n=1 Tax=Impatiens glandulifera TaxID=253017 RepID=UPI001FB16B78|nr:diacylglycerol O-acyltransferase 1-like [Impatiens glandulifera]